MPKKFWSWNNDSELLIDGTIAEESWFGDEVTPKAFRDELESHAGDLTVRINSPGGDVFAGVSIYNMLVEHEGRIVVKVDGMAASIASLVAMAGDEIVMLPGAMMLVHCPWTSVTGNFAELEKAAEAMRSVYDNMVPIYAERTGLDEDKVRELLEAETWLTAQEAVELGFATEAVEPKSSLSSAMKAASEFIAVVKDANIRPAMAMIPFLKKKIAEEIAQPNETEAEAEPRVETEAEAEIEAEAKVEDEGETEAKQSAENVTEPAGLERSGDDPQTLIEERKNEVQDEILKAQAIEPKDLAEVTAAPRAGDYLKTKASVRDFAEVLRANAGKTFSDVRAAWSDMLVKNNLTDKDYFALPEPLVTSIEDAITSGEIFSRINKTGLDVFKVVWDKADAEVDTSRAGGHKKGGKKAEQVLDFESRTIRGQYIYKYLVLDRETIRENRSTGALLSYVMNELPTRIVREIERAIVIGDGRGSGDARKINSFTSIKSDVDGENAFAARIEGSSAGANMAQLVAQAKDAILSDGEVVVIAKKGFSTKVRFAQASDGKFLFPFGTSAEAILGVNTIIEPTWFTDATDPDYDAYVVVLSKYNVVGDTSVEAFTNFKLETNEHEYLQEIYLGGGLAGMKAAAGIAAVPGSGE